MSKERSRSRTTLRLAAVEGPRLLIHPWFLAGLVVAVVFSAGGPDENLDTYNWFTGRALSFVGLGTFFAAGFRTIADEHHGLERDLAALPAPERALTAARLLAVVVPTVIAVVLAVAGAVWTSGSETYAVRTPGIFEFAQGPVVVAAAGVLGVLVAKWLPHPPALGAVGVGLVVWTVAWNRSPQTWFNPAAFPALGRWSEPIRGWRQGSVGWHVVWLLGLIGIGSALALLRHGWRRGLGLVFAVALAITTTAGILQLP